MALRILKEADPKTVSNSCIVVPCFTREDAGKALSYLNLEAHTSRFVDEFDPGCEDGGNVYVGEQRLAFVGLAKATHYGKIRQAFQVLSGKLRSKHYQKHVLLLAHLKAGADQMAMLADAAVNGLSLGCYDFGLLKTSENGSDTDPELDVIVEAYDLAGPIHVAEASAKSQMGIFSLVNLPSSHKTPEILAEWARKSGKEHGYTVTVLEEDALKEKGFHALLAVNRGSELPARLIVSEYNGTTDDSAPIIAFVGKGVTFDTGGLNLKLGDSMHLMKSDMGGAAAVLGAVDLIARLKAHVRVIGCVPTTDNSIGTNAIKPGDVIDSYSGKTIEVINTDAEGRLILADGLNYIARQYKPDVLIDLATLTGSIVRTLGYHCAGLFTHSDSLADAITHAGDASGERVWRLPIWEEYGDEMKSEIADIKNLSDKPAAGAITAAKFLEFFTENHPAWAHLDIAGTAFKANGVSKGHFATAYGVRLLYEFACNYHRE